MIYKMYVCVCVCKRVFACARNYVYVHILLMFMYVHMSSCYDLIASATFEEPLLFSDSLLLGIVAALSSP